MKPIQSLVLFLVVLLTACSKTNDVVEPATPTIEYDPTITEVLDQNSKDDKIGVNCMVDSPFNCEEGMTQLNICYTCETCKEDTLYSDRKYVRVMVESLPDRVSRPIGIYELDENYHVEITECVMPISGQQSHIIGFNPVVSNTMTSSDRIIFNNINLTANEVTHVERVLDFEDMNILEPCNISIPILFSEDPNNPDVWNKKVSICLLGSYGDCTGGSVIGVTPNWPDFEQSIKSQFRDYQENFKGSVPCSGMYIRFDD